MTRFERFSYKFKDTDFEKKFLTEIGNKGHIIIATGSKTGYFFNKSKIGKHSYGNEKLFSFSGG